MRLRIAVLLLTTAAAFAQHRGGFGRPGVIGGGIRPGGGHFGIKPGLGHAGFRYGFRGGFLRSPSGFGRKAFGFQSGFGASSSFPFYSGFPVYAPVMPFAPLAATDWYSTPQPPAVVIIAEPRDEPPRSSGAVIINNTPVIPWRQQDYRVERDLSNDPGPIVYLIALKDGAVWAAVAYWVDGSTLHLVTRSNEQMTFPIGEIDRSFSERLNRERRI